MATENISCNRKSNRHIHLVAIYHVRKMLYITLSSTVMNRWNLSFKPLNIYCCRRCMTQSMRGRKLQNLNRMEIILIRENKHTLSLFISLSLSIFLSLSFALSISLALYLSLPMVSLVWLIVRQQRAAELGVVIRVMCAWVRVCERGNGAAGYV